MPISATNLNKAYLAYFGRPADAVGQAYFATLEQADVIKAFDASAESQAIYGGDTAAKINAIYKNLFNREAEPAGLTYWLSLVSSGRVTPAGAAFSILEGAQGTDKTAIDNKLAASEAFIKAVDTTTEIVNYSGLNAAASARAFLATVDASAASLTAAVAGAQAAVTSAISSTGSEASSDNVLKTTQDILSGTSGNDTFRGVAGRDAGAQDQTTLNSSDILDGGAGADTLIVNMTGLTYNGGARIKNIETLQIGTNQAATFDYNINAGANEITEVTTIVADQINGVETLTVNNIVRTVAGDARVMPTLSWVNDSNTATAGTVAYNYRAAELTGTTDTQIVSLDSVNNGVLNLAAGIETVTLRSVAGERVTLRNSTNTDGAAITDANFVAADIISAGSLTRVNIEAAAEVGKVGGRRADGLIDRVATDGVGLADTGTAANLLSVGSRVTTVDANTSTANVNVQFLAKTDGAATNVTFTGGAGNDYAEFEIGNINATGGVGNDTFAFVTQRNGVTNSTFGAGDSIVGGAGTDVIQIGVNGNTVVGGAKNAAGASTYTISDSEWANKSGVEIVDLRGATNTITLSSGFVAAPDAGVKLTVTTDNMVVGGASNNEYNSVNTVDLRVLSGGQGINFVGGQGSDRLILSDSTYTAAMTLNGGSNVNAAGAAVAGDYDTLTVSNSAVLDRTDLSATSGFEGLVLNKTVSGATTTVIEMSEAFLLANTAAADVVGTSILDNVFQVGTAAGANGTALTTGDTVRIDVTDLFTIGGGNPVKTSVSARQIDTTTLTNAGVTLQYVFNGATYNSLAALNAVVGANTVLAGADVAGQTGVVGAAAGLPGIIGRTFNSNGIAATYTGTSGNDIFNMALAADTIVGNGGTDTVNIAGAFNNRVTLGAGNDTINFAAATLTNGDTVDGGAGADTLNIVDDTAVTDLDNVTNVETINITNTSASLYTTVDALVAAGATLTVNALAAFDLTFNGAAETNGSFVITGNAGADTITGGALADTIDGGTGADSITGGAGNDVLTGGLLSDTIAGGAGSDTINLGRDGSADVVQYATATGGADTITGFEAGAGGDTYDTNFVTTGAIGTMAAVASAAGAVVLNTAAAGTFEITGAALQAAITDFTSGAQVLAAISGTSVSVTATTHTALLAIYTGGNAYVYQVVEGADGDALVAAADVTLVGTFTGIVDGAFAANNFA